MSDIEGNNKAALYTIVLVAGMLITGSANTILTKLQDKTCIDHCDKPEAEQEFYEEPLWQTLQMFIGEFFCWIIFWISERRVVSVVEVDDEKKRLLESCDTWEDGDVIEDNATVLAKQPLSGASNYLLAIPTICDLIATTLMNVGFLWVAASIYQMLRGAVIVFTAILSVIFLKARLTRVRIFALCVVIVGISIVGLSSFLQKGTGDKKSTENILIGTLLILGAQCFSAVQFVVEEKILSRYSSTPMKLVGLEGMFGCIFVLAGMGLGHLMFGLNDPTSLFNLFRGWNKFVAAPTVWVTAICSALSIGAFNWFGLNVTKYISATSRTTIDTCRTLFIWIISILIQWEKFDYLQLVGFVVLIYGTFVFNQVISPIPFLDRFRKVDR